MYINKHFRQKDFLRNTLIIVKLHYTFTDEAYLSINFNWCICPGKGPGQTFVNKDNLIRACTFPPQKPFVIKSKSLQNILSHGMI